MMTHRAWKAVGTISVFLIVCSITGCRTTREPFTYQMHPLGGGKYSSDEIKALKVYLSQRIRVKRSVPQSRETIDPATGSATVTLKKEEVVSIDTEAVGSVMKVGTDAEDGAYVDVSFPCEFDKFEDGPDELKFKFEYSDDQELQGFRLKSLIRPQDAIEGDEDDNEGQVEYKVMLEDGEIPYLQYPRRRVRR